MLVTMNQYKCTFHIGKAASRPPLLSRLFITRRLENPLLSHWTPYHRKIYTTSKLTKIVPAPPSSLSKPPGNVLGALGFSGTKKLTTPHSANTVAAEHPSRKSPHLGVKCVYSSGLNMPRISLSSCSGSSKLRRSCLSHQSAYGSRNCRFCRGGL